MTRTLYALLEEKFIYSRIHVLEKCWNKCISVTRGHVEKWQKYGEHLWWL